MHIKKVVIGSRGSRLALVQAEKVRSYLENAYPQIQFPVKIVKSGGDKNKKISLTKTRGVGFFVKELEGALLKREIDVAVHSLKDVPVELAPGLVLGAVTQREVPYDALVSRDKLRFNDLAPRATVGTGSVRRRLFLRHLRPDLKVVSIRGNLDTRLKKLFGGNMDAIVVAACGLYRLGKKKVVGEIFPARMILPCAGQGCLGVEVREKDPVIKKLIAPLNHSSSRYEAAAEKEFIHRLGGGCHLPVGVLATANGRSLQIQGAIIKNEGERVIRTSVLGKVNQAKQVGRQLADTLLEVKT